MANIETHRTQFFESVVQFLEGAEYQLGGADGNYCKYVP